MCLHTYIHTYVTIHSFEQDSREGSHFVLGVNLDPSFPCTVFVEGIRSFSCGVSSSLDILAVSVV